MSFRIGALTMPLVALTAACAATPAPVKTAAASPAVLAPISEAAFSEELTERTFRYFWDTTDTQRCLAPDRWPSNPFCDAASARVT